MKLIRVAVQVIHDASATAFTVGDSIASTPADALRFKVPTRSGKVLGARAVVTPASASVVITALDFDLILFRPAPGIPFADAAFPADNAACTITAAMYREFIGKFSFLNTAWRNELGALTAGATATQAVAPAPQVPMPYNLDTLAGGAGLYLLGLIQVVAAWTPLTVLN